MLSNTNPKLARVAWWAARGAVAVGAFAASSACSTDKILTVTDPDVAPSSYLNSAAALPIVLGGAVASFHAAFTGTGDVNESSGQIGYSGLLSDELRSSDTFPTRDFVDQRVIQTDNSSNEAQFILLSRARAAADLAAQRFNTFGANKSGRALAYDLGGYSTILFGENYCSGVPFSTLLENGTQQYGSPLTTNQMFARAISKFDSALASSTISSDEKNLALVGKARALLDSGDFAGAKAVAATVPVGFVYEIQSSKTTTGQNNGVFTFNWAVGRITLADKEGTNGLDYLSANDPRVGYFDTGDVGFDGETELILQMKDTSRESPAVLASGIEAKLIVAEATLQGGDYAGALVILNSLRTNAGLTALVAAATPAAQVDQLFRERAFWLYLTSHRLGDMRRLVRQYGRGTETVFPTGPFPKGGLYGPDVNMPVPDVELNNPNFHGCLNRSA
jgi:SusD family.